MIITGSQRDVRQPENTRFLATVQEHRPVATIYSIMEVLGQLSFNLSAERLRQWPTWLRDRYRLAILHPETAEVDARRFFQREFVERPLAKMQERIPFMDALILNLVEDSLEIDAFVTWNAGHFADKTSITVLTPGQYLASYTG